MPQLFANNASSTLASGISSGALSLTVAAGQGARFPTPTGGDYFRVTLTQPTTETSWEIVEVSARSGDVLTITRAQEGTSAAAWGSGTVVQLRLTAETVDRFEVEIGNLDTIAAGLGSLAFLNSAGTTEITNDAVTYAKMQNVTDARLLGRSAGSSGDPQEITVGSGLSLSGGNLAASGTALSLTFPMLFGFGGGGG